MKEAIEPYLTEEALKQVWHSCSTQKNEALNKWSSKIVPKDKILGGTCTLNDRLCMVVIEDSASYKVEFNRVLAELHLLASNVLDEWCCWKDNSMGWI